MSCWRKTVALLTLLFFANSAFAVLCELECSTYAASPVHHPHTTELTAAHHLLHHTHLSNLEFSVTVAASSMDATLCEHPSQAASRFKLASEKTTVDTIARTSALDSAAGSPDVPQERSAESPPLLNSAPLRISLRI